MTLKEIAARAGVHTSTVSRILNSPDDSFASRAVRERVWAIAKETGYVPNPSAQALRRNRSRDATHRNGTLACILGRTRRLDDNPFFAQVARAVEQQALTLGYSVQVSYSALDMPPEGRPPRSGASRPAGAIVLGRFVDQRIVRTLERQYRNIVFVGRSPVSAGWDQVICDGYEATVIAIDHLIDYGHRRIGYIGEIKNEVRYHAFTDTLKRHDLKAPSGLVAACDHNSPEGGYEGAGILLKKASPLPTAVFCASDVAAIAALRRFRESKIRVPSQLSIISLDNTELSAWITPMLTTVGMPIVEMGAVAVQTLVGRINRLHGLPQKIYLPNKLASRESVVNLNEGLYI